MKDFIQKWKTDSKFKAKTQLGFYTAFVVLVSIFAISAKGNVNSTNTIDTNNDINLNSQNTENIKIPNEYNYTIDITINDKKYQYNGTKKSTKETIGKVVDNTTINYIYQDNNYYKEENGEYIMTTKEEVYNVVDYNYLKLETINQYLSKSIKENEIYKVYLKDIILGNDSDEYITITINENKVNVDYTSLMKLFDNSLESYLIEIITEEIE